MTERADLPDLEYLDSEALKALIRAQHAEILRQNQALVSKDEQLQSRDAEIEHLKLLICKLRREQYGRSSEKLDRQIAQLELRLGELEASRASDSERSASGRNSAVGRPARRPLPANLPREVRTYAPPESDCRNCGRQMKQLGEDVSEMLEYVPEHFKVIRHVRKKLVCIRCDRIVQAMAPSRPIERGIAGPGLLAHVLVSKYCDHLPLYRQSEIYGRNGWVVAAGC
jgi:transposase